MEEVDSFLKGSDPQESIIKVECGYKDHQATVIFRDEDGVKHYEKQDFYPFCWAKKEAGEAMLRSFKGDRLELSTTMQNYGIKAKSLIVADSEGNVHKRMDSGYKLMFYATRPMSASRFSEFFDKVKVPLKPREGH